MALGLTGYEQEIYKALLKTGSCSVRELSKECKVPLTAIYPHIQKLVQKKLVLEIQGNVLQYKAIKPKQGLDTLYEEQIKKLEEEKNKLLNEFTSVQATQQEKEVFTITHGKERSINWFESHEKKIKEQALIYGWRFRKKTHFYALHQLKRMQKRGIHIRLVLTEKNKESQALYDACKKEGIPCRFGETRNFSLVILDGCEAKITLKGEAHTQRYNLHFTEKEFVNALKEYFEILWKSAS